MKPKWWRIALSFLAFAVILIVGPAVISLVQLLLDLFTPRYLQGGRDWALIAGDLLAPIAATAVAGLILGGIYVPLAVFDFVGGIYCVGVGVWNLAIGKNDGFTTIWIVVGGIVYISIGIWLAANLAREGKRVEGSD